MEGMTKEQITDKFLSGADLSGVNLSGFDLKGIDLYPGTDRLPAQLSGANLDRSDLRGSRLRGIQLTDASLNGTNLEDSNLFGASNEEIIGIVKVSTSNYTVFTGAIWGTVIGTFIIAPIGLTMVKINNCNRFFCHD